MLDVKSSHDTNMYYKIEKALLSSRYGMMVRKLTDEEKEAIRDAYKSGNTHAYFDTDSIRKEG